MSYPATLTKAPGHILYPDRADRLRALQKVAARAAAGSAVHFRRLRRLPEHDKQMLWHSLSPEVQAALKRLKASLDAR